MKSTLFSSEDTLFTSPVVGKIASSPTIPQCQTPRKSDFDASMLNLTKANVNMEVMPRFVEYEKTIREFLSKSFAHGFPVKDLQDTIANLRKEKLGMIRLIYASFGDVGKHLYNENEINSRLVSIEDETSWKYKDRAGSVLSTKALPRHLPKQMQHIPEQIQQAPSSRRDPTLSNSRPQQMQQASPSGRDPLLSNIRPQQMQQAPPSGRDPMLSNIRPQQMQQVPPSERNPMLSNCQPQQMQQAPLNGRDHMLSNSLSGRSFHGSAPNYPNSAHGRGYDNSYDARHTHNPAANGRYPSDVNAHTSIPALSAQGDDHNYINPSPPHSYGTPSIPNGGHGHSMNQHPNYPQPSAMRSQVNQFEATRSGSQYTSYPQGSSQIPRPSHQMAMPHGILQNPMNHPEGHLQYSDHRADPMHRHRSASPQQHGYGNNRGDQYHQAQRQPQQQQQAHYPYLDPDPRQQRQDGNDQPYYDQNQPQGRPRNEIPSRQSRGGLPPPPYYNNGPH